MYNVLISYQTNTVGRTVCTNDANIQYISIGTIGERKRTKRKLAIFVFDQSTHLFT
jgi:hypothetical protein